jgi:hypothetical protein
MPVLDLNKVAGAGFAALVLGGSTLVSPAVAVAADLPPYFEDQGAVLERPPVRSRLAVEETYIAPPVEHRIVGRRVIEQGFVGGYEGPPWCRSSLCRLCLWSIAMVLRGLPWSLPGMSRSSLASRSCLHPYTRRELSVSLRPWRSAALSSGSGSMPMAMLRCAEPESATEPGSPQPYSY